MVHGVQEFRGVCRRFRERYRWSMEFRTPDGCREFRERYKQSMEFMGLNGVQEEIQRVLDFGCKTTVYFIIIT